MPYPTLPGRRLEYDIGGFSVYVGGNNNDIEGPLSEANISKFNSLNNSSALYTYGNNGNAVFQRVFWIFMPSKYDITGLGMVHYLYGITTSITVAGSPDSTNGLDGTWISATLPNGAIPKNMTDDDVWRDSIQPCSFSEPVKVLRVSYYTMTGYGDMGYMRLYALHVYGNKAIGELPEDILFLDDDSDGDPEFLRDMDWGDRPEGTTILRRIRLFNSSPTKIASSLNLSIIDPDFLFSMNEGETWITGTTITSIAPLSKSSSILIKNVIPPPTQLLGPRAPRFEVTIGEWLG